MLDSDGTGSSTQVSIVRCAWVHAVMSYLARHLIPLFPSDAAFGGLGKHWAGRVEDLQWADRWL
jgi:hypothetical protein